MALQPINELVSLAGQVAIVTGGAKGIGEGIARRLAEAGAAVVIADMDEGEAQSLAKELEAEGHRAVGVPGRRER